MHGSAAYLCPYFSCIQKQVFLKYSSYNLLWLCDKTKEMTEVATDDLVSPHSSIVQIFSFSSFEIMEYILRTRKWSYV